MPSVPITPDFDHWPIVATINSVTCSGQSVRVSWSDKRTSEYHAFFLRENSPEAATLHPVSREAVISPLDLPEDLHISSAQADPSGALKVVWAHDGYVSRFDPGWLHAHGWFGEPPAFSSAVLWTGKDHPEPRTFDGPKALDCPATMLAWLDALQTFGVARLAGLPQRDGLLEDLVSSIGTVRESNFGRSYNLEIKEEPDSNAYTSDALLQHIDMPTRECPHGLQFLFCRTNTASGGEGIYCDGYRIAEDLRTEAPDHFSSLTTDRWEYNNRSKTSSYRASGPVVELGPAGEVSGIRFNTWLRAPLVAPLFVQERAYLAVRAFAVKAQDPKYQMIFAYRAGDLLAFDNRRVLHGRNSIGLYDRPSPWTNIVR